MKLKQGKFCPLIGKDCIELECSWLVQVRGLNPQTGQEVDEWGCAITWLPMLMIENSQQQRQTGAAVESFRNEMVRTQEEFILLSQGKPVPQDRLMAVSNETKYLEE